jgi:hypothetical protein
MDYSLIGKISVPISPSKIVDSRPLAASSQIVFIPGGVPLARDNSSENDEG